MLDSRLLSVIMIANKNFRGTSAAEMPHIEFANHATRILRRLIVHSFVVRKRGAISGADNVRLGYKVKRCFLDAVKDRVGGGGGISIADKVQRKCSLHKGIASLLPCSLLGLRVANQKHGRVSSSPAYVGTLLVRHAILVIFCP